VIEQKFASYKIFELDDKAIKEIKKRSMD